MLVDIFVVFGVIIFLLTKAFQESRYERCERFKKKLNVPEEFKEEYRDLLRGQDNDFIYKLAEKELLEVFGKDYKKKFPIVREDDISCRSDDYHPDEVRNYHLIRRIICSQHGYYEFRYDGCDIGKGARMYTDIMLFRQIEKNLQKFYPKIKLALHAAEPYTSYSVATTGGLMYPTKCIVGYGRRVWGEDAGSIIKCR